MPTEYKVVPYRHFLGAYQFRTAYNFSRINMKCDMFACLIENYVTM